MAGVGPGRAARTQVHTRDRGARPSADGSLQGAGRGVAGEVVGAERSALTLECGVPMILDGVVGPAGEEAGYGGPFVAEFGMGPNNGVVLVGREGAVLHLRRELVAPPQAAALAGSAGDGFADEGPVSGAVLLH